MDAARPYGSKTSRPWQPPPESDDLGRDVGRTNLLLVLAGGTVAAVQNFRDKGRLTPQSVDGAKRPDSQGDDGKSNPFPGAIVRSGFVRWSNGSSRAAAVPTVVIQSAMKPEIGRTLPVHTQYQLQTARLSLRVLLGFNPGMPVHRRNHPALFE